MDTREKAALLARMWYLAAAHLAAAQDDLRFILETDGEQEKLTQDEVEYILSDIPTIVRYLTGMGNVLKRKSEQQEVAS